VIKNDNGNENGVFVKGPFINFRFARMHLFGDELKPLLGSELQQIGIKMEYLIPDLFGKDGKEAKPFLIMRDLCDHRSGKMIFRSSRTVKDAEVFDKTSSKVSPLDFQKLGDKNCHAEAKFQLLLVLSFRYIFEVTDTCTANILVVYSIGNAYSIDENNLFVGRRNTILRVKVTAIQKKIMVGILGKFWKRLESVLEDWKGRLGRKEVASCFEKFEFGEMELLRAVENLATLQEMKNWERML